MQKKGSEETGSCARVLQRNRTKRIHTHTHTHTHTETHIYTYLFSHSLLNLLDVSSKTVNLLLHVNSRMYVLVKKKSD